MKHRWRDAGPGLVECEVTKERRRLVDIRPPTDQHVVILTDAEWSTLERLAAVRKSTPEECVRAFIAACQPGGSGWVSP